MIFCCCPVIWSNSVCKAAAGFDPQDQAKDGSGSPADDGRSAETTNGKTGVGGAVCIPLRYRPGGRVFLPRSRSLHLVLRRYYTRCKFTQYLSIEESEPASVGKDTFCRRRIPRYPTRTALKTTDSVCLCPPDPHPRITSRLRSIPPAYSVRGFSEVRT